MSTWRKVNLTFFCLLMVLLVLIYSPLKAQKKDLEKSRSLQLETSDLYLKNWIQQDVLYIITEEEKNAFNRLSTDEERYQFIEQFWIRRDPSPDSILNENRNEHYRRIAYSNERFFSGRPGWMTDRGRIYITFGPPDQIESHPTGGHYERPFEEGGGSTNTFPFEIWRYRHLEGADLGNEVIIEFVDPTMTGEYRMTMDPSEKDALINIPNAGLTTMESRGIASKKDRFNNPSGMLFGEPQGQLSRRNTAFERLYRHSALQRPPKIKFKDLEIIIDTKLSYNLLPFNSRTDFFKISENLVLVSTTIQILNNQITFKEKQGVQQARINIFGRVSTITGRVVQVFEDVINKDIPNSSLRSILEETSLYQRSVTLPSGRYKLELVLKDVYSGNVGTEYFGFIVPKYRERKLSTSSVILADQIKKLSAQEPGNQMFDIGGTRVYPNVKEEFTKERDLRVYFQVYNLAVDEKTNLTSVSIEYIFRKDQKEIFRLQQDQKDSIQSSELITLEKILPLKSMQTGFYRLEVKVTDNISQQSIRQIAKFKVKQ